MVYIVDMVSTVEYGSQRSEQPQNVNFETIIIGLKLVLTGIKGKIRFKYSITKAKNGVEK